MTLRSPLLLLLLPLLFAWPTTAQANMAAPWDPGDIVGEPQAELADIDVVSEALSIDLGPIAKDGAVHIKAVYKINNRGAERDVDLFFVAPGLESGKVTLDGEPVAAKRADRKVPESWEPHLTQGGDTAAGILFTPTIGQGEHTVSVEYTATATRNHGGSPIVTYELDYILAPARQWGSFGTLDLTIDPPDGWSMDVNLATTYDGELWKGTYKGLPDDNIKIVVTPPTFSGKVAQAMPWLALLLAVLLCVWLGWRSPHWGAETPSRQTWIAIGVCVGAGVVSGVLFFGATMGSVYIPPEDLTSRIWSYGLAILAIFVSPVVGIGAMILTGIVRGVASRRLSRSN